MQELDDQKVNTDQEQATPVDATTVATEALPVGEMSREQLLEELYVAEPQMFKRGDDNSEMSDDELREFVANSRMDREALASGEIVIEDDEDEDEDDEDEDDGEDAGSNLDDEIVEEAAVEVAGASQTPDPQPQTPVSATPAVEEMSKDQLAEMVKALRAELDAVKSGGRQPIKSGSKARANVKYFLLEKAPGWSNTPQVAQLQHIMYNDEVLKRFPPSNPDQTFKVAGGAEKKVIAEIPEPELFDLIKAGHDSGVLRTKQEPVRIFQYYRSELEGANCLRHS